MSTARRRAATLRRRDAVARILARRGEALVVTGLGSTSWDAAAAGDHPCNFYLWGGMGGAVPVGLGLALAQPQRRVLVLAGDGEMLMGLGSIATVAVQRPANLAVVVVDNEHYGETGRQPTHTRHGVDLAGIANAAGFAHAETVRTRAGLDAAIDAIHGAPGPVFVVVKVDAAPVPLVLPERDGAWLKSRFRLAVVGRLD